MPEPPEPLELPWPIFELMSKNKTFRTLLDNWEQKGPSHTQFFKAKAAFKFLKKLLPHAREPWISVGQHSSDFNYDMGDGWVLDVHLEDHRGSRVVTTDCYYWATMRIRVPRPDHDFGPPNDTRWISE